MRRLVAMFSISLVIIAGPMAGASIAAGNTACVDLGKGAAARTECHVSSGSILFVPSDRKDCVTPISESPGKIWFVETDPTIVPRIPIPEFEWWDIRRLNNYFLEHRDDFSGKVRFFWKYCRTNAGEINVTLDAFPIAVPITDPLLDIRLDVEAVAVSLPLPAPILSTLPEPDVFYGLKVNNPAWISVTPASWQTVVSPTHYLRGWEVTLIVRPVTMTFTVEQGGRTVTVACDPGQERYVPGSNRFPTEPAGFTDEANWFDPPDEPLPTRACSWTPRAKGAGNVTVAITYDVRASAGGFLFQFAPRTNAVVAPIDVTELRTVNLRP